MTHFPNLFENHWNSIDALGLNVLGGILAAVAWELINWCVPRLSRKRYREVFGNGSTIHLVYGNFRIPSGPFPLTKDSDPSHAFRSDRVASSCEVRAAAYLSHTVSVDGRSNGLFEADDQLASRLDFDFIAFGVLSNLKARDSFKNASNDLCDFDERVGFFVWKGTSKPLCQKKPGKDYGVILKIHPDQFPDRTWIVCAGLGEWGTSGAAWFLAKKWKQIRKRINTEDKFLAVVAVETGKDESSILLDAWNERLPEMPIDPTSGHITAVGTVSNSTVTTIGNK
jgi:hypothetical protein